ncbi:MAG: HAD family hydrolase, partial [Nitrososphaerales archaeon]
MAIYKISNRLRDQVKHGFSGIIFDCDGVLIDASKSYGATLEVSARSFAAVLGFRFEKSDYERTVRAIQLLGTFNNDWDTLAVLVAFCYAESSNRAVLDRISLTKPLRKRITEFEASSIDSIEGRKLSKLDFSRLDKILRKAKMGTKREEITRMIFSLNEELMRRFAMVVSYPKPVGKGLLATFFDEVFCGELLFEKTYGITRSTELLSKEGKIANERVLASEETLEFLSRISSGNLGIITGRPEAPTIHTLGKQFLNFFSNPEICLFTGDHILNAKEMKPSPKPMLRVARALKNKKLPIMYVGDAAEDVLMVKRSNSPSLLNGRVMFAGIASDEEKAGFFLKQGNDVDCVVSDTNEMVLALKGLK